MLGGKDEGQFPREIAVSHSVACERYKSICEKKKSRFIQLSLRQAKRSNEQRRAHFRSVRVIQHYIQLCERTRPTYRIDEAFLTASTHELPAQSLQADYLMRISQCVPKRLIHVRNDMASSDRSRSLDTRPRLANGRQKSVCRGLWRR